MAFVASPFAGAAGVAGVAGAALLGSLFVCAAAMPALAANTPAIKTERIFDMMRFL